MASLRFQPQVRQPPAYLRDRFYDPMRRVALVWAILARAGVPIEITSWWRPEAVNAATRGSKTYSQHLVGTAIDGLSPGLTRAQLLPLVQKVAARLRVSAPTSGSEGSGRSVHVQGLPVGTVQRIVAAEPTILTAAEAFVGPPRPVV